MKNVTTSLILFLFLALTSYAQECVERVVCYDFTTTAFLTNGDKYSWGWNEYGQLGNNTTENQPIAVPTVMADSWQEISHGYRHALALHTDGTLWGWGWNEYGQLGDGTTQDRLSPVQVSTDTDWVAISAGNAHSLALKSDGTLWGWGSNFATQLLYSTTMIFTSPFQLTDDTDWKTIQAMGFRTFGIKTNGTLWVRGKGQESSLGLGITNLNNIFKQIGTDTTWARIVGSSYHTLALKTDNTLWSWGKGILVGQGSATNATTPTQIGNDQWKDFSAGSLYSLGVKMDGTLWQWGRAFYMSVSSPDIYPERLSPEQVQTDDDWESVANGMGVFFSIKEDQTLWVWGGFSGNYINGNTDYHFDPILLMDCSTSTVNTADYDLEKTTFYPNPVKDFMEWTNNKDFATYHITNMLGQTIKSGNTKGDLLNLSELNTGMYLLILQTKEGQVVRHKFLKS